MPGNQYEQSPSGRPAPPQLASFQQRAEGGGMAPTPSQALSGGVRAAAAYPTHSMQQHRAVYPALSQQPSVRAHSLAPSQAPSQVRATQGAVSAGFRPPASAPSPDVSGLVRGMNAMRIRQRNGASYLREQRYLNFLEVKELEKRTGDYTIAPFSIVGCTPAVGMQDIINDENNEDFITRFVPENVDVIVPMLNFIMDSPSLERVQWMTPYPNAPVAEALLFLVQCDEDVILRLSGAFKDVKPNMDAWLRKNGCSTIPNNEFRVAIVHFYQMMALELMLQAYSAKHGIVPPPLAYEGQAEPEEYQEVTSGVNRR
jgi:hypothetical protein